VGVIFVLIALYLPGHFLGGGLARKGDGLAEVLLLRVCAAAAVACPVLVALALLGRFEAPVIAGVLLAVAGVIWLFRRRGGYRPRFFRWDLAPAGLGALGAVLYSRPAEYVINDRDPGVYTIVGAKLARTGELFTRDPLVAAIAPFHEFHAATKYPGFYILGEGLIVPQFFPGPFVWLGVGNLMGGVQAGLFWVVPVFGALSVAVAFLLGRELFGRWAGMLGAALLAVGYTQVWWARHPSSEVISQFFILGGLWLAARFASGGRAREGVLAGALLGGAMLVRVDAFLAASAVPLLVGYDLLRGGTARRWLPLCIPLALFAGAALLYATTLGGRYLELIRENHGLGRALELAPHIVAAVGLLAALLLLARRGGAAGRLAAHGRSLALLWAAALVGAALWAYFLRPGDPPVLPEGSVPFRAYDEHVAVRMVWFLTPAVAALGLAGFLLAARRLTPGRFIFLGAAASFAVLYVALPNVAPDLPWATRRFVPAVFPGLCLLAGYAVAEAGRFAARWRPLAGVACAAALAALALGWTVHTAWPVYGVQELRGGVEGFERVNAAIPEARVVFVELPGRPDDYGAPLEYLHGRPVLAYDSKRFREELDALRAAGLLEDAIYVTVDGLPAPSIHGLEMIELAREEVTLPRLRPEYERVPSGTYELQVVFRVYRLEDGG
jgi:hypothetical protein